MEEEKTDKKDQEGKEKEGEGSNEEKKDDDEKSNWRLWAAILIIIVIGVAVYFWNQGTFTGSAITDIIPGGGGDNDRVDMITLGFMGPLTGEAASYGNGIRRGVELALGESDAADVVEIVFEDSMCEGTESVNAINKLISVDGAVAVIGEACSGATIPAVPIATNNQVVLISAASTSPDLSGMSEYFFRTVPSDRLQGRFAADMIYNRGHYKLAILYPQEDYGVGLSTVLQEEYENLGGEVVASEAFQRGTTDLRTQLTKIKEESPDAIYFISNSPDAAVAGLKQIKELRIRALLFGSEGLKGPDTLEAGSASEGLTVTSVSVGSDEFASKFRDEYGEEPGPFSAQGYDAMMALAIVIDGGATNGVEIKDALKNVQFEGASGFIDFDGSGDVTGNYDIYIVFNNDFVLAN